MRFKELMKSDNEAVLDIGEFGQLSLIDNVIMKAQKVYWTEKMSSREDRNYTGLYGDFVTIYFKAEDYLRKRKKLPKQGDWVFIDGKRYQVQSCQDELGLVSLIVKTYRQNLSS